jgi:hypothetical protein
VAEAGGIEVGAEIGEEEVGEDVCSRRLAGAESRERADMETSTGVAETRTGLAIRSGYFAVVAIILIVAVALWWGLTHI